jgi:phosphatidylglycerol:prolipoprotein diacylglycerol transferase
LYEAFFEGLVLFVILWSVRNGIKYKNKMFHVPCFISYVFLYGFFRFVIEFFREPDLQIGFFWPGLTLGQILSLAMILAAMIIYVYQNKGKKV